MINGYECPLICERIGSADCAQLFESRAICRPDMLFCGRHSAALLWFLQQSEAVLIYSVAKPAILKIIFSLTLAISYEFQFMSCCAGCVSAAGLPLTNSLSSAEKWQKENAISFWLGLWVPKAHYWAPVAQQLNMNFYDLRSRD